MNSPTWLTLEMPLFSSRNDSKIVLNCLKVIEQPCPWSSEWKPKFCYSNHLWMWHKYIPNQYHTCTFLHNINRLQCVALYTASLAWTAGQEIMLKISVDYYCLRLHDCEKSNTWSVLSTLCQTQWKKLKLVCESLVIITLNCFWILYVGSAWAHFHGGISKHQPTICTV